MFSPQDRSYITDQIFEALGRVETPRQFLTAPFVETSFIRDFVDTNSRMVMAYDAVRLCIKDGWNSNPVWMERLLNLFGFLGQDPRIKAIWELARIRPVTPVDTLDTTVLNNSMPFVNRKALRQQLIQLATPAGNLKPILVVTGEEKSGKSYSANYIDYYCNEKQSILSCQMIIQPGAGLETGAEKIAKDLVRMMGAPVNDMPPSNTNFKKYTGDLAGWVMSAAASRTEFEQYWFILDNFDMQELRDDARDLLIELSSTVTTGIFSRKCRVIIIGFDRALLKVAPGKIEEDIATACTEEDLVSSIKEITGRTILGIGPEIRQQLCDFVKTNLPAGKDKMAAVNDRLSQLLYALTKLENIIEGLNNVKYEALLLQMIAALPPGKAGMDLLKKRLQLMEESKNNANNAQ